MTPYEAGYQGFTKTHRNPHRYGTADHKAWIAAKTVISNPNKADTQAYREWERGFNAAYFYNKDKVTKHE